MPKRRHKFCIRAFWCAAGACLGVAAVGAYVLSLPPSVTPEEHRYGLAENHAILAAPIVAASEPFRLTDADGRPVVQDNERAVVLLWEATVKVLGRHTDNYAQQIGDCTSFGAKNALEFLLCVQIARDGPAEFHPVFPPFQYGVSRHQIGKDQIRGDGSVGAWVARSAVEYGVLAADDPGVPAYSGSVAKQWGNNGPPAQFLAIARERLVKAVSPIRNATEGRDAICNGYPFTIASDYGSTDIKPRDGQQVARRNTRWMHQMAVVGFDGTKGAKGRFYVLNSWGPTAHPAPLNGEPPGGFWVEWSDMEYITQQGDSWAYSDLQGFKARDLNFNVFGHSRKANHEREVRIADRRFGLAL